MKPLALTVVACAIVLLFATPAQPAKKPPRYSTEQIIRIVFGKHGSAAVRVARCESGLSVWARNGQYLGTFQMGSYARGRYGHTWDAWGQARAAYRYFAAAGYDWSPWTCKPW